MAPEVRFSSAAAAAKLDVRAAASNARSQVKVGRPTTGRIWVTEASKLKIYGQRYQNIGLYAAYRSIYCGQNPTRLTHRICMKTNARVVVVGGGMMGASLLYHLALEGCSDTILIEKSELTSGSTWHAAGQCPSITGSYNLAKIHAYSKEVYPTLEALTGQYVS